MTRLEERSQGHQATIPRVNIKEQRKRRSASETSVDCMHVEKGVQINTYHYTHIHHIYMILHTCRSPKGHPCPIGFHLTKRPRLPIGTMQVAYMHEFLLPTGPQKEMTRGDIIQPKSVYTGNEHVKPRQIPDANHVNLYIHAGQDRNRQ